MQHPFVKGALALVIAGLCGQSMANGLAINEQSVSGMGTAFAGRSSSAQDASTVFGNPAGMSRLQRSEVSGGFAFVNPSTDIDNVSSGVAGSNNGDIAPKALVPFAYLVSPLSPDLHVGLGLYVPFGVISDNEKSFQGRGHGLYSKVQVTTLQPTLSYRLSPQVSLGFGPTINKLEGKLTNILNTQPLTGSDTKVNIEGDDVAYGFNAGVLVELSEATRWGLAYHSKVDYSLEGRTKFDGSAVSLGALGVRSEYDASLDLSMPESFDTSITHQLDARWTLYLGTTWTRWSRLEEILVENEGANARFARIREEMGWRDTWSHAVGTSYQLNPQWVLRAGLAYDQTPTTNAHRNVRIPVGDRKIFSLGAGWTPSPELTIDLAYAYIHEEQVRVNQPNSGAAGPAFLKPAYSADYRNSAHGFGTQLSYRF